MKRQYWLYTQQGWKELEKDPLHDPSDPPQEDFDKFIKRKGYSTAHSDIGNEYDEGNIQIYHGENTAPYPYYVDVTWSGSWVDSCHVEDFPALLEFLRLYSPSPLAFGIYQLLKDLHTTTRKAFEAWHGHNWDEICQECDEDEYQDRQRRNRERLAKQSK